MSTQTHRTLTAHLAGADIRLGVFKDREHLVAPVVLMVGDIVVEPVTGDGQGEFIPRDVLQQAPSQWDGRPVIPGHPPTGSANTRQRLEARQFGVLFGTRFERGRLLSEAWLDPVKAEQIGPDAVSVIERLRRGESVEVSVGAWVTLEEMQGTAGGKEFARRWLHLAADHLAMLEPGKHGACSVADGCGAPRMFAANQHHQQTEDKSMTPEEIHAAVQALRAEMAATKARKAAERKDGAVRNRILREYAADAAFAAEVKPGPYDVALGRKINADLDLYDVLLPSTGEPTAELPAPPRPYDEPIRQLRERDRMREAHR